MYDEFWNEGTIEDSMSLNGSYCDSDSIQEISDEYDEDVDNGVNE